MQSFKNFLKSFNDKEEEKKLKENKQFLLFNPDIDEKKRIIINESTIRI